MDFSGTGSGQESTMNWRNHGLSYNIISSFLEITPSAKSSIVLATIVIALKYWQLAMFVFLPQFSVYWSCPSFFNFINVVFDYLHFSRIVRHTSWQAYIIAFFMNLSLAFIFVFCSAAIYFHNVAKKPQFGFATLFSKLFARLYVYILFIPAIDLLLSINECERQTTGTFRMVYFPQVVCFKGFHLSCSILGIIVAALFLPLVLLYSGLFFEPMLKKGMPYNR
jgi:hypothetical protein